MGLALWHSSLNCCLQTYHLSSECWFGPCLFHSQPCFLLMRRQRRWPKYLNACIRLGDLDSAPGSWLLVSVWSRHDFMWISRWKISFFCWLLSSLSNKLLNKSFLKKLNEWNRKNKSEQSAYPNFLQNPKIREIGVHGS